MDILSKAKRDWKKLSQSSFDLDITFTAPGGAETATVKGIATSHHISIDTDGQAVNTENVHCTVVESNILDANPNYPIRSAAGEVSMRKHKVEFVDSNGDPKTFVIVESFPDNTVNVLTFILAKFSNSDFGFDYNQDYAAP